MYQVNYKIRELQNFSEPQLFSIKIITIEKFKFKFSVKYLALYSFKLFFSSLSQYLSASFYSSLVRLDPFH